MGVPISASCDVVALLEGAFWAILSFALGVSSLLDLYISSPYSIDVQPKIQMPEC